VVGEAELSSGVRLRAVEGGDLGVFFEIQADREGAAMAAVPMRDRTHFDAHWAKVRLDRAAILRTVLVDDVVAGNVVSWAEGGQRLVGYWIGREHWGRGVATRALALFVGEVPDRPLYAHVATHNAGSIRVLEKCGFQRDHGQEAQAPEPEDGVEEFIFVLAAG
jgi:RimJ/RimL family protein N-acetyltransferase